jgi:hypothetical protein
MRPVLSPVLAREVEMKSFDETQLALARQAWLGPREASVAARLLLAAGKKDALERCRSPGGYVQE